LLLDRGAALAEADFDGALECLTPLQSCEDSELFPLQAPEIHHVVDAMHGEPRGNGFEAGDGGDFLAFLALGHGVAGNVGAGVMLDRRDSAGQEVECKAEASSGAWRDWHSAVN